MDNNCDGCRWGRRSQGNANYWECRANPPTATKSVALAEWPKVDPEWGWCREFSPQAATQEPAVVPAKPAESQPEYVEEEGDIPAWADKSKQDLRAYARELGIFEFESGVTRDGLISAISKHLAENGPPPVGGDTA